MHLLLLRPAPFTNSAMLGLPLATQSLYNFWANAFIATTLCAVPEVGDARSAAHCIVGIYCIACSSFQAVVPEKYKDVL